MVVHEQNSNEKSVDTLSESFFESANRLACTYEPRKDAQGLFGRGLFAMMNFL